VSEKLSFSTTETTPETIAAAIRIIIIDLTGKECPLGDRVNMVYMGSTIVYGRGYAVITATGMGCKPFRNCGNRKADRNHECVQNKVGRDAA